MKPGSIISHMVHTWALHWQNLTNPYISTMATASQQRSLNHWICSSLISAFWTWRSNAPSLKLTCCLKPLHTSPSSTAVMMVSMQLFRVFSLKRYVGTTETDESDSPDAWSDNWSSSSSTSSRSMSLCWRSYECNTRFKFAADSFTFILLRKLVVQWTSFMLYLFLSLSLLSSTCLCSHDMEVKHPPTYFGA